MGAGIEFDGDVVNLDYFVALGSGSRRTGFALSQWNKTMSFLYDAGDTMDQLGGGSFYVTDHLRTPDSSPSSAPSAGGISGTVVGVIVVISGVFLLIVMRCWIRRSKDSITTTTTAENQSVPDEDDDISVSSKKMGYDSEPNYIEGKYSDASYAEGQTGSIDILPMAPITPIPEHMQEELRVLQERMRVLQDQIRATQFSSHPRPNVVTTVSNIAASTASGAPESAPGSGNITTPGARTGSPESIPNVPSNRLSESMDLGYSSAPAYSSVINQASLQSFSEVAPQEFVRSSEAVLSPLAPS